jgi:cytochrome c551/c552
VPDLEDVAQAYAAIGDAEQHYRAILRAAIADGVKQADISRRLKRSDEMLRQDAMTDEERQQMRERDAARKREQRAAARERKAGEA